jgi:hypothetical protein
MDWQMWEGFQICFKWHTNVQLRKANDDNCIDREERGMSITMHAVIVNRRATRRDRVYMNIQSQNRRASQTKGANITIHAVNVNRTAAER